MNNIKPILSIETTGSLCGACIYFSEKKFFEANIHLKNSHAEKLFQAIESVMKIAGVQTGDLSEIAVSSGPGSFTGLRIGMSAAKGIAFGSALPIVSVPTFEAMALQISKMLPEGTTFSIGNKVNSDEIYFAKFQIIPNNYIFVENLMILNHEDFKKKSEDTIVFGNAVKFLNEKDINEENISAPNPVSVAEWAVKFGSSLKQTEFDYLEPNYLKNFIIRGKKNV